jgi:hypothetical protein
MELRFIHIGPRRARHRARKFRRSNTLVLAILLSVPVSFRPIDAESSRDTPSALEIFDAALAKVDNDHAALGRWQYHQTLTTHQLDHGGNVIAKGTWHSIVRPGDPHPLEYISKHVEGKISFFEAGADEQQSVSHKPAAAPPLPKETPQTSANETESIVQAVHKYHLRDRYEWHRLADGKAAGEDAYVLTFTPKPNQNTSTREERFFGHLSGRIWISQRDFTTLRAEGALQSPTSLFWLLARVTTFRFTYNVEPISGPDRLLRSSRATATTVVSFPFYKVRQKHWQTVDKYEPRTPRGTAGKL